MTTQAELDEHFSAIGKLAAEIKALMARVEARLGFHNAQEHPAFKAVGHNAAVHLGNVNTHLGNAVITLGNYASVLPRTLPPEVKPAEQTDQANLIATGMPGAPPQPKFGVEGVKPLDPTGMDDPEEPQS